MLVRMPSAFLAAAAAAEAVLVVDEQLGRGWKSCIFPLGFCTGLPDIILGFDIGSFFGFIMFYDVLNGFEETFLQRGRLRFANFRIFRIMPHFVLVSYFFEREGNDWRWDENFILFGRSWPSSLKTPQTFQRFCQIFEDVRAIKARNVRMDFHQTKTKPAANSWLRKKVPLRPAPKSFRVPFTKLFGMPPKSYLLVVRLSILGDVCDGVIVMVYPQESYGGSSEDLDEWWHQKLRRVKVVVAFEILNYKPKTLGFLLIFGREVDFPGSRLMSRDFVSTAVSKP